MRVAGMCCTTRHDHMPRKPTSDTSPQCNMCNALRSALANPALLRCLLAMTAASSSYCIGYKRDQQLLRVLLQ